MKSLLGSACTRILFDGVPPRSYGAPLAWGLFVFLCRVTLAAIFIIFSIDKVFDIPAFARSIEAYKLLPPGILVNLTAVILPWVELLAAACLVLGVGRKGALLLLSGLLVMYIGMFLVTMARGLDIDCGCFEGGTRVGWGAVFRDLAFLLPAVFIFWNDWLMHKRTPPQPETQPQTA